MKIKDNDIWFEVLSPQAKAEILSGVLHKLESMPNIMLKLPKPYRDMINRALIDCSIDSQDMAAIDHLMIRHWFAGMRPKVKKKVVK